MADRLIFTPPQAIRQMIADLAAVAAAPAEILQQLSQLLAQQTGFVSDKKLDALISQCIEGKDQQTAAFNALHNVQPDSIDEVLEMVQAWRKASPQNLRNLPDEQYAELQQKLPMLIQEYPALLRMRKAERLRAALGNEFKAVGFICDARPIYNQPRDRIEGMIPLTTMRIVYERQNGDAEVMEITMSGSQLDELITEAKKAQKKLPVLRESIADWITNGNVDDED